MYGAALAGGIFGEVCMKGAWGHIIFGEVMIVIITPNAEVCACRLLQIIIDQVFSSPCPLPPPVSCDITLFTCCLKSGSGCCYALACHTHILCECKVEFRGEYRNGSTCIHTTQDHCVAIHVRRGHITNTIEICVDFSQ